LHAGQRAGVTIERNITFASKRLAAVVALDRVIGPLLSHDLLPDGQ